MQNQHFQSPCFIQDTFNSIYIWNTVFSFLSEKKVFFILPQVCKALKNLANFYKPLYEKQEFYWKKLCLKEAHASWDGKTFKIMKKGKFLSWKKAYFSSEFSWFICKMKKYEKMEKHFSDEIMKEYTPIQNVYKFIKKHTFGLTNKEIKEVEIKNNIISTYEDKIESIESKKKKLLSRDNIGKLFIRMIGRKRFDAIPRLSEWVERQAISIEETASVSAWMDTFWAHRVIVPSVVCGMTHSDEFFMFLKPQHKNSEGLISQNRLDFMFLFTEEKHVHFAEQTLFPNGACHTSFSESCNEGHLKQLHNLIVAGYDEKSCLSLEFPKQE